MNHKNLLLRIATEKYPKISNANEFAELTRIFHSVQRRKSPIKWSLLMLRSAEISLDIRLCVLIYRCIAHTAFSLSPFIFHRRRVYLMNPWNSLSAVCQLFMIIFMLFFYLTPRNNLNNNNLMSLLSYPLLPPPKKKSQIL